MPPLNASEIAYLKKFAGTRRMDCEQGPYYVDRGGFAGQDHEPLIKSYNRPPPGQPGLWCQWEPTEDGTQIVWDGGEKFYEYRAWLQYLIDHFLISGAHAQGQPGFEDFTFDHLVEGSVLAVGEDDEKSNVFCRNNIVEGAAEEIERSAEFKKALSEIFSVSK
jgi:hypothetical protein